MKKAIIRLVLLSMVGLVPLAWAAQDKSGTTVTLEGQVVCSFCWFEEDRKVTPYGNEGDLKCAVDCMKKGKSQALAVTVENGFKLYLLEPGKLKRDRKDWLDFIAKQVRVTGTIREDGTKHYLRVDSIQVVSSDAKPVSSDATTRQGDSEVQKVTVSLTEDGYDPASFQLKRDVPARVTFVRKVEATCGTEVVIKDYDIKRKLPLNEPVVVEFTPRKSGEFTFTCGMGMLHGKVLVQ